MKSSIKWSGRRGFAQLIAAVTLLAMAGCGDDEYEPPPPVPLADRTPKVIVIGIDGVRPDVLAEVATPNIDGLISGGTFSTRTRTTTPSVSGPGWSSMLTGVWPEKHGVTNNDFTGRRYDEYPDFLTRIERVRPELATFAAADWLPLMEIEGGGPTLSDSIDARVALDGYETGWAEGDLEVMARTIEHLSTADPDALFVYLGNPDETSHQQGSIGEGYRAAIEMSDAQVGRIIEAIRLRPTYRSENWLVLISTDHGRTADGGHGGDSPEEMTIFFLASGPGATRGTPAEDTFIVDVAVTALAHLGIEIDPEWGLDGSVVGIPGGG